MIFIVQIVLLVIKQVKTNTLIKISIIVRQYLLINIVLMKNKFGNSIEDYIQFVQLIILMVRIVKNVTRVFLYMINNVLNVILYFNIVIMIPIVKIFNVST